MSDFKYTIDEIDEMRRCIVSLRCIERGVDSISISHDLVEEQLRTYLQHGVNVQEVKRKLAVASPIEGIDRIPLPYWSNAKGA